MSAADPKSSRETGSASQASARSRSGRKLLLAALVVIVGFVLWTQFRDYLSLTQLATQESQLRALQNKHPLATYTLAFLFYVAVTGLSLPGALVLTVAYGWFFGFLEGTILVSFASTAGATLAFLLSRYFLRDAIHNKFGKQLAGVNQALEREGPFYLFSMRLIPALPFFMINLLMGLTPMRTTTYWWVSQLGMLPATIAYVLAGSSVPDLATLANQGVKGLVSVKLLIALAILGLFPLTMRAMTRKVGGKNPR